MKDGARGRGFKRPRGKRNGGSKIDREETFLLSRRFLRIRVIGAPLATPRIISAYFRTSFMVLTAEAASGA